MIDLEFRNHLVDNVFATGANYYAETFDLLYPFALGGKKPIPFILKSPKLQMSNSSNLYISSSNSFGGRCINISKFKEMLNTARVPTRVAFDNQSNPIYVGKGIIIDFDGNWKIIAAATYLGEVTSITQMTYYIDKDVYTNDRYKRILPVIKDVVTNFPGDIVLTANIKEKLESTIEYPRFATITEEKRWRDEAKVILLNKLANDPNIT